MKKIRVGIFGGTFNPPHCGHVAAAESFYRTIKPDEIMIIPDCLPPHKEYSGTVTEEQRLEMCKLAFGHIENVTISDMEIKRGGRNTQNNYMRKVLIAQITTVVVSLT